MPQGSGASAPRQGFSGGHDRRPMIVLDEGRSEKSFEEAVLDAIVSESQIQSFVAEIRTLVG